MPLPAATTDQTLVFIHNLKTAGSTMREILLRQYEPKAVFNVKKRHARLSTIRGLRTIVERDPPPGLVQGHIPFGIHELLPSPCRYITFVRDPIDRIISLYYYTVQQYSRTLGTDGGLVSLEDFARGNARRWGSAELDNGQTRRLSGLDPEPGCCSRDVLERAKENVRRYFALVGLTERFDESLILLRRMFGWRDVLYVRRRVTNDRPYRDWLSADQIEVIRQRNALDLELYEYARRFFADLLGRQGEDFEIELEAFRRVNHEYQQRETGSHGNGVSRVAPAPSARSWSTPERDLRAALLDAYADALRADHEITRHQMREARVRERFKKLRASEAALSQEVASLRQTLGSPDR